MNIIFEKRLFTNANLKDDQNFYLCGSFVCSMGAAYDADFYYFLGDMTESEANILCKELSEAGYESAVGVELEPVDAEKGFCVSWS